MAAGWVKVSVTMRGPVVIACALIALAVAPGARADVTIGSTLAAMPGDTPDCQPAGCTLSPTLIPGQPVTAPDAGVVTRWEIRAGANVTPVSLQVVRRPAGPGAQPGSEVGRSAQVTPPPNARTPYATRIPIAAGDYIAIECCTTGVGSFVAPGTGATLDTWAPPLGATALAPTGAGTDEVLVNATIEPDADGDGFGDETQDNCRSS